MTLMPKRRAARCASDSDDAAQSRFRIAERMERDARSRVWRRQIQADVYGRAVEIAAVEEGAAYGAALLAGVGAKIWARVDEACAGTVRVRERVELDTPSVSLLTLMKIG